LGIVVIFTITSLPSTFADDVAVASADPRRRRVLEPLEIELPRQWRDGPQRALPTSSPTFAEMAVVV
jgi:hypothetical protein